MGQYDDMRQNTQRGASPPHTHPHQTEATAWGWRNEKLPRSRSRGRISRGRRSDVQPDASAAATPLERRNEQHHPPVRACARHIRGVCARRVSRAMPRDFQSYSLTAVPVPA
eukprot:scaffold2080_cov118-Isochrysis_galbana.AAC.4